MSKMSDMALFLCVIKFTIDAPKKYPLVFSCLYSFRRLALFVASKNGADGSVVVGKKRVIFKEKRRA